VAAFFRFGYAGRDRWSGYLLSGLLAQNRPWRTNASNADEQLGALVSMVRE